MFSTNNLGAFALVVGPILAFVMFLMQPGGLLVQTTPASQAMAMIGVWMSNSTLTMVTSGFISLGLVIMAFGIYEVHAAHRGSPGDGLNMAGLAFVSLGIFAWVITQTLTMPLANANTPADALSAIYVIRHTLLVMGGLVVSIGIVLFCLGVVMDSRGGLFLIASWIAGISALISGVFWLLAAGGGESMDFYMTMARSVYVIWSLWLITLAVRLYQEGNRPASDG